MPYAARGPLVARPEDNSLRPLLIRYVLIDALFDRLPCAQKVRVDRLAGLICAVGGLHSPLSQKKPTTLEGHRLSSRRQGGWESASSRAERVKQRPKFLGSLVRRSYFLSVRR